MSILRIPKILLEPKKDEIIKTIDKDQSQKELNNVKNRKVRKNNKAEQEKEKGKWITVIYPNKTPPYRRVFLRDNFSEIPDDAEELAEKAKKEADLKVWAETPKITNNPLSMKNVKKTTNPDLPKLSSIKVLSDPIIKRTISKEFKNSSKKVAKSKDINPKAIGQNKQDIGKVKSKKATISTDKPKTAADTLANKKVQEVDSTLVKIRDLYVNRKIK